MVLMSSGLFVGRTGSMWSSSFRQVLKTRNSIYRFPSQYTRYGLDSQVLHPPIPMIGADFPPFTSKSDLAHLQWKTSTDLRGQRGKAQKKPIHLTSLQPVEKVFTKLISKERCIDS